MSTLESPQSETPGEDPERPLTEHSGRSPEEIETEIEYTRDELSRTFDALESRLSPRQRLNAAADSARQLGQRAMSNAAATLTPDITNMIRLDHTHVLALFRRFKPWTTSAKKQALIWNACIALEVHAQLEEEIFYPALREAAGHSKVLDQSVPDHDAMRALIEELRSMEVGDPAYDETVHTLMRAVLHHVADEESVLLPLAESTMREQLGQLGAEMTRRRFELLGPNLGPVAVTTMRSFPVITALAAGGILASLWMVLRPRSAGR
jgi:hemerythrin superfamily protein